MFAFLTTEPNKEVVPVHEKAMPVLLLDQEVREETKHYRVPQLGIHKVSLSRMKHPVRRA